MSMWKKTLASCIVMMGLVSPIFIDCAFAQDDPLHNQELHYNHGGHFVVLGRSNSLPFSGLDGNGEAIGHDVDIVRAIADHLGKTVEFRLKPWSELLESMEKGEADILLGGEKLLEADILFGNEELLRGNEVFLKKKEQFWFTLPVFIESYAIFTKKGPGYKSIEEIKSKRIAAASEDAFAIQGMGFFNLMSKFVYEKDLKSAFDLLIQDKVDVVIAPYSLGVIIAEKEGNIAVGRDLISNSHIFAMRKGKVFDFSDVNYTINFLKNKDVIDKINKKWLRIRSYDIEKNNIILRYSLIVLAVLALTGGVWGMLLLRQRAKELHKVVLERTHERDVLAQFRKIIRGNNLGMFDVDLTKDIISDDNIGIFNEENATYSDAVIDFCETMVHPNDKQKCLRCFSREYLLKFYEEGKKEHIVEYRRRKETGGWLWVQRRDYFWQEKDTGSILTIAEIRDVDKERRNFLKVKRQAERDVLTGLYNRNGAETIINDILEQCDMKKKQGFYILDLDDFKAVNDTFGHIEGDLLLLETAGILTKLFRRNDVIARLGGDEFVVFCRDCCQDLLIDKAKHILAEMSILSKKRPKTPVSISLGIVLFPDSGEGTFDSLYTAADKALYRAKRSGKNCYNLY